MLLSESVCMYASVCMWNLIRKKRFHYCRKNKKNKRRQWRRLLHPLLAFNHPSAICLHVSIYPAIHPCDHECSCVYVSEFSRMLTLLLLPFMSAVVFRPSVYVSLSVRPPVCPSICLSLDQSLSMSIPRRFFYDVHVLVIDNGNYHSYLMWHCSFVGHYFFLSSSSVFERGVPPRASYAPQVLAPSAIIVSLVKTFLHCSFFSFV